METDKAIRETLAIERALARIAEKKATEAYRATVWIGAFRYYLGRATYAVGDFCDALIAEWPELSHAVQSIIRGELEGVFEVGRYLGHDCGREQWQRVRDLWAE